MNYSFSTIDNNFVQQYEIMLWLPKMVDKGNLQYYREKKIRTTIIIFFMIVFIIDL